MYKLLERRGVPRDEISAQEALQREAIQEANAQTLHALQEKARRALSLSLAARLAHDAGRNDLAMEDALLAALEGAQELAALVDAGRGNCCCGSASYAEAIGRLAHKLREEAFAAPRMLMRDDEASKPKTG